MLVTLTSSLVQQIPTAMQDVKYSTIFIVGSQVARAVLIAAAALTFRSVKSIVIAAMITQVLSIVAAILVSRRALSALLDAVRVGFLQGAACLRFAIWRLRHAVGNSERPG